ncbi:MAG TPA: protein kinase [Polyangiaceae bacterium]|nr:protein kinase [Polyangiaceae bacterium]
MSGTPQGDLPFERLGEYTVLAPISEGGMASVWLGRTTEPPGRFAALKVIRAEHGRNKEFVAMFLDEARIASRLSHPNIIAIHGLGHDGKRHFLAMEVLRGRTLLELWEKAHSRKRRLPYEVVAWIGARVADALHHAHELRDDGGKPLHVIHRDVSPSNVFLTDDGVPKLIDFGLAKARDRIASTAIGVIKGKLAYLAPEQVLGHSADRRADIFALGVTLWEISLDRRLFRSDSDVETVRRVRDADVPDPTTLESDYPPALAEALKRALAKDPAARFQTAAGLRDALDAFVQSRGEAVDEKRMQALVADVFDGVSRASWERLIDEAAEHPDRIRVWDDDGQKMTWMNAAVEAVADGSIGSDATTIHRAPKTRAETLDDAIVERAAAAGDGMARARALLERALVSELLGDGGRAAEYAAASVAAAPTGPAFAMLRRLHGGRGRERQVLAHLDGELAETTSDAARADLLAERARLIDAAGGDDSESREAWGRVLDVRPDHPAGLRGLEAALAAGDGAPAALADHLARMSDAYERQPRLAAWLQVERAHLLDRRLAQPDAAKAALLRGSERDRRIGPVRASCVRHAVVYRDAAWLVALLADEAAVEGDPARAAALELDAACIARRRLGDPDGAVALLERAAARVPIAPEVHSRIVDELAALHEGAGRAGEVLRARRLRLTHLDDARARAQEQRGIATLEEILGDGAAAVAALERAAELAPDDATLVDELDHRLEAAGYVAKRIDLWTRFAAAAASGPDRARRLLLAASLAATEGTSARAVELARAAIVADPSNPDAVDRLLGWLATAPAPAALAETNARIAAHAHGAEHASDESRRIAHLEAIAVLQEEMLGDAQAAASTYETVLRFEPGRRAALVGLARNAARAGDTDRLVRALLREAEETADPATADALRVRAAGELRSRDEERSLALVRDVLSRTPGHVDARRLEQRLHEAAGRWAQVDASLAARLDHATGERERVDLWLARAEVQRTRLRAPRDAIASLQTVVAIDPEHPGAREAIAWQLEALGDARLLRDGLAELASTASVPAERARWFARAAEIAELVLSDDVEAAALYARAREALPGSVWLEDRELRVHFRLARSGDPAGLRAALGRRVEKASGDVARAFDLALELADDPSQADRATALLEEVLAADPTAPHALRALERVARATGMTAMMANTLAQQAETFADDAAKLGALWAEEALIEWKLPEGDPTGVVDSILERAPTDRAALALVVRLALPRARAGDAAAHARLVGALRSELGQATAESERLYAHLALGILLEPDASTRDETRGRAALLHYRKALEIDSRSVVAAEGAGRLGLALGDPEAVVASALAHADLTSDPRLRAAHLVQAAGQTLAPQGAPRGTRSECLARAGEILERALEADPEALPAVALLIAVRTEEGTGRDRLLPVLRSAFDRARASQVVIQLGTEVARLAAIDPPDRLLAIDALRRLLATSPGHLGSLRALADHCAAMEAWGDAVASLEPIAAGAREPRTRLAALFDLADVFGTRLGRPADVERVLREALDIDPMSVDALRRLLTHRRAAGAPATEIATWLARLGEAETSPEAKATVLTELAELLRRAGDAAGAEKALVEATAQSPKASRLSRLAGLFTGAPSDHARALNAVVARGRELERPDAASFAALGRLEVDALGRWAEGVGHLRLAIGLAPGMHEARAALARGLTHLRAGAEATSTLLPMLVPDAGPLLSLADPAAALGTLEAAFAAEGRHDEAAVVRELRAIAGGLDDGAHAELRSRRHSSDPAAPVAAILDQAMMRASVVPESVPALLLDLAAAIAGAASKFVRVDMDELGVSPRGRLTGHPLPVYRLAKMFGLEPPDVVASARVTRPRVVPHETPWIVMPESLLAQPEPVQAAALMGPLVRLALGVPWMEDLRGVQAQAVLCAAARQVLPGYSPDPRDPALNERLEDWTRRLARAIGRKQKKALQELAPALGATRPPSLADVEAFEEGLARTTLRTAFLVTGDLLATLDAARAADPELNSATANVGKAALAAVLTHPLTRDVVSFALAPATTALRRKAGTTWGRPR